MFDQILSFYGLQTKPFRNEGETRWLMRGTSTEAALRDVARAVEKRRGVILLLGEGGIGKTALLDLLNEDLAAEAEILRLKAEPPSEGRPVTRQVFEALRRHRGGIGADRMLVLMVDDAEKAGEEELQRLLELADPQTLGSTRLQLVLAGRPEIDGQMERAVFRCPRRPVVWRRRMEALPEAELVALLRHRLKQAGATRDIFAPEALARIAHHAKGLPRQAGLIATNALFFAYPADPIQAVHVEAIAVKDGDDGHSTEPLSPGRIPLTAKDDLPLPFDDEEERPARRRVHATAVAAALVISAGAGVLLYQGVRDVTRAEPEVAANPAYVGEDYLTDQLGRYEEALPVYEEARPTQIASLPDASDPMPDPEEPPILAEGIQVEAPGVSLPSVAVPDEPPAVPLAPELEARAPEGPQPPQLLSVAPLDLSRPEPQPLRAPEAEVETAVAPEPAPAPVEVQAPAPEPEQPSLEERVAELLGKAEDQARALALTRPPGDNALETYREVLALVPDEPRALAGIRALAGRYADLSVTAERRGDMARAQEYLDLGLSLAPDHPVLRRVAERREQEEAQRQIAEAERREQAERELQEAMRLEEEQRARQEAELRRQVEERQLAESQPPQFTEPESLLRPVPEDPPGTVIVYQSPQLSQDGPVPLYPPRQQAAVVQAVRPLQINMMDNPAALQAALDSGADANTSFANGRPALVVAAERGRADLVRLLLDRGAQPDLPSNDRATALMYAAWNGDADSTRALLSAGANPNLVNLDGKTPLMGAALQGHDAIVRLLLDRGANPDIQAGNGWTALMYAVWQGNGSTVALLRQAGANPDLRNAEGETARDLAQRSGQRTIVGLME
ncbi:ankyrin repeat domain-containing protein [Telmatospirillum sp. J64-1]|uniref:ankyrin repeat domain-containing protein n=1 Tax=Telmatospirillum sp. J64-1 TaxID=2502183 RepID=UPI00115DF59F|nr:ankyrin repeat domain-containing protein [Telmatospirillum sp. J64-1]